MLSIFFLQSKQPFEFYCINRKHRIYERPERAHFLLYSENTARRFHSSRGEGGSNFIPNMQDSNLQQASLWNCKEFASIITKRHSLLLCDNSKKSLKRQLTGKPFSNSDVQSLQPEDICPGRFPASHLSSPRFYKESQLLPVIILFCLIHHGSIMCG